VLADAAQPRLHIFDNTKMPPKKIESIELRDEPGWITFGIDGKLVYPSTGEVVDTRTRKIVATLKDENGMDVQSENSSRSISRAESRARRQSVRDRWRE